MSVQTWTVTEPYLDIKCKLGEGPFHNRKRNQLRFVDIWNHKLHILDLAQGPDSLQSIDTGLALGVTADIEGTDQVILTGAKDGITKFNTQTATHEYIHKFWTEQDGTEKTKRMRSNDGIVDSAGRFWLGVMNDPKFTDEFTDEGVLLRLNPDGSVHRILEKVTIPNGISWNEKEDTLFFTDSPTGNIYAFDFDTVTGNISNQRVFFHLEGGPVPDGHAIDVEDCIWTACYGGAKVLRISPQGNVIGEILLPTRNITCPVFVGNELFITSAEEEDPEKYPDSAKRGGNLFRVNVGVHGRVKHEARLAPNA